MNTIHNVSLCLTKLTFAALAPALVAQSTEALATPQFAVIGRSAAAPLVLEGIRGALAVHPEFVMPWSSRRSVSGVLEDLLLDLRLPSAPTFHYQMLVCGPAGPELSQPYRYPALDRGAEIGGDEPETGPNAIKYPQTPRIELTLRADPGLNSVTRHLVFENHAGDTRSLRITFRRTDGNRFVADAFPDGLDALTGLADTGNRSYWDRMRLENRTGGTALDIGHVFIVISYGGLGSDYRSAIPVVSYHLNRTLGPAPASVSLDVAAVTSRRNWAGISDNSRWCMQLAAEDLGKSGSDGADNFGRNPKYRGADENLCSEFVSWYNHQAGYVIGGQNFRDVTLTQQIDDAFRAAGRLYGYHLGRQRFENMDTGAVYTPQAGDFLERRGADGAEHSMLVLRWDNVNKVMTVINGPWPVTLRDVKVQELEESGKDFRVGRL